MIQELGALVEEALGSGWAVTEIPFGWQGGYLDARRVGHPERVVVAFGDHPRAATTVPFIYNRRGPHFGLRMPDDRHLPNCRGYHFHGDLDWAPTLKRLAALDTLKRVGAEVEGVGTRVRARAPRLGEWQLRPFVAAFLELRAAILEKHEAGGRRVRPDDAPSRDRRKMRDRVLEQRLQQAREATASWDGRVERKGEGLEGRLSLPGALAACGARLVLDGDRRLRLRGELPRAIPGPVSLTPQRGLLGWLHSFSELKLDDDELDPAWLIDAPPEAADLLRALKRELLSLAGEVEVEVRAQGRFLVVEASERALPAALNLWRAAAERSLS